MNGDFEHGKWQGEVMAKLDAIHSSVENHGERIRTLESFKWWVLGIAAAGGIGAGITVPKIVEAFFR